MLECLKHKGIRRQWKDQQRQIQSK